MFSQTLKIRTFMVRGVAPGRPPYHNFSDFLWQSTMLNDGAVGGLQGTLIPQIRELTDQSQAIMALRIPQLILIQVKSTIVGVVDKAVVTISDSVSKRPLYDYVKILARPVTQSQVFYIPFSFTLTEMVDRVSLGVQLVYQQTSSSNHIAKASYELSAQPAYDFVTKTYDDFLQVTLTSNMSLAIDQKWAEKRLEDVCDKEELEFLRLFREKNPQRNCDFKFPVQEAVQGAGEVISKVYRRIDTASRVFLQPRTGFLSAKSIYIDVPRQPFIVRPAPIQTVKSGDILHVTIDIAASAPPTLQRAPNASAPEKSGLELISWSVDQGEQLGTYKAELILVCSGTGQCTLEGWDVISAGGGRRVLDVVVMAQ